MILCRYQPGKKRREEVFLPTQLLHLGEGVQLGASHTSSEDPGTTVLKLKTLRSTN